MTVNVLGTEYTVTTKKYDEDAAFKDRSIDGYCDAYTKQIVLCDLSTYPGWEKEPQASLEAVQKLALRHEIVHAFLAESGLMDSASVYNSAWCSNEEMVDWVALQGPKIFRTWQESGAL